MKYLIKVKRAIIKEYDIEVNAESTMSAYDKLNKQLLEWSKLENVTYCVSKIELKE